MKQVQSAILDTQGLLEKLSQHPTIPMIVGSPHIPLRLPEGIEDGMGKPRRLSAYLFFFMIKGSSTHNVDMEAVRLESGHVLFVQPNQIHQFISGWKEAKDWYKLAFDAQCLGFLPQSFDFLMNPLNKPVVSLIREDQERLTNTFESLAQILVSKRLHSTGLVLAHLNVLLAELNDSYFRNTRGSMLGNGAMEVYLAFKQFVEKDFKSQPPVQRMAKELSVSENKLYSVVRQFAGVSPKTFLLNRTMLEAQRIFYYDRAPVKEVAYDLGFNDPDHFSKVFKSQTGKTVTQFLKELQDLYGK